MTRIAILSRNIEPADAIGTDVQHMAALLCRQGHEVELFRARRNLRLPRDQHDRSIIAYLDARPDALVIYHHATGYNDGIEAIAQLPCKRIVRYHNVTPEEYFQGYSSSCVESCRHGRQQLAALIAAKCDLFLADSLYNRSELLSLGAPPEHCLVLPPFHRLDELAALSPDPRTLADCRDNRVNLLFVGRCAPNKGHRHLLNAFAIYRQHYNPRSRLLLVGKEDHRLTIYRQSLRWQIRRLGLLNQVELIDGASDRELRAYYASASVFLLASEHEGFCVPVVEAMALGLPIVAYGTTATPETIGPAGLVWESPDPYLLAGSIHQILQDEPLRQTLRERGWERYRQHFATNQLERQLLDQLGGFLSPTQSSAGDSSADSRHRLLHA